MDRDFLTPRESLKSNLWTIINSNKLVVINASRRMGKTTLMRDMTDKPKDGFVPIWIDLQSAEDERGLTDNLYSYSRDRIKLFDKSKSKFNKWMCLLSELKLGPVTLPKLNSASWKSLAEMTINSLISCNKGKVVIFLDELPLLLHKIMVNQNPNSAAEVLNFFRAMGEKNPQRLTLVYAGSLGLHHILNKLNNAIRENPPMVNTAFIYPIPTLEEDEGSVVAKLLFDEEGTGYDDQVLYRIWEHADGVPFYIRQITLSLFGAKQKLTVADVDSIVQKMIGDANDLLHIEKDHFLRLQNSDYYENSIRDFVLNILDRVAQADNGKLDEETLYNEVCRTEEEKKLFKSIISALEKDHLLKMDDKVVEFMFSIVRRSWLQNKVVGR